MDPETDKITPTETPAVADTPAADPPPVADDPMAAMDAAMLWVDNVWGNEPVMTRNILNPAGGEFPIARKQYGGCCDPGTELYHCM